MNGELDKSRDGDFALAGRDAHDSDLMWSGEVLIPRHDNVLVDDGGVCAPPVTILDELDSSPSLSYILIGGFSSCVPWFWKKKLFYYYQVLFVLFVNV